MGTDAPRIRDVLRHAFLTGVAVIVPLLITLIVLAIAFNYIYDYLDLFSDVVLPFEEEVHVPAVGTVPQEVLVEVATPLVLLALIMFVGLLADSSRYGQRAVDYFDYVIEQIPGVGSVYESFRRMSDVMLESDSQNFQEVVLVEFPTDGTYVIAFVTSETPASVTDPVGEGEMTTLFMPMAPNPVMGGHVVFVPTDRITDVDLSVEEGIRALVTSGVAIGNATAGSPGLTERQLRELTLLDQVDSGFGPDREPHERQREGVGDVSRSERYDQAVDPERARTPDSIARRARDEDAAADDAAIDRMHGVEADANASVTPAERAGRYRAERDGTDREPERRADREPHERDDTEATPGERADRDPEHRERTEEVPENVVRDEEDET